MGFKLQIGGMLLLLMVAPFGVIKLVDLGIWIVTHVQFVW